MLSNAVRNEANRQINSAGRGLIHSVGKLMGISPQTIDGIMGVASSLSQRDVLGAAQGLARMVGAPPSFQSVLGMLSNPKAALSFAADALGLGDMVDKLGLGGFAKAIDNFTGAWGSITDLPGQVVKDVLSGKFSAIPGHIQQAFQQAMSGVKKGLAGLTSGFKGIKNLAKKGWSAVKGLGSKIGRGLKSVGRSIGRGVRSLGRSIGRGVSSLGRSIGRGVRSIGRGLGSLGRSIGRGLSSMGRSIGRALGGSRGRSGLGGRSHGSAGAGRSGNGSAGGGRSSGSAGAGRTGGSAGGGRTGGSAGGGRSGGSSGGGKSGGSSKS